MPTEQFAKKYVFDLLMYRIWWQQDPQGIHVGGFGMKMKSKTFQLRNIMFTKWILAGNEIVSSKWLEESSTPLFETYEHVGAYGYHWWVLNNERFHTVLYVLCYGIWRAIYRYHSAVRGSCCNK